MAAVSVELTPQMFPIKDCEGTFRVNDTVKIEGAEVLSGEVREIKTANFGNPPTPGLSLSIAVTAGNVSAFKTGGFAGYTVKADRGGAKGVVRTPCLLKLTAQLMQETELQKMLDAAESLIKKAATHKSDGNARKWFGSKATTKPELAKIHKRCADLQQGVAGLSKVILQCAASEMLGAISTADPLRHGPVCRIQLGRGFSYTRYSWGERVCTIVHEMTHWFLDTVDATLDSGADCYGGACIRLAESDSENAKALNNADNWAYYICEYRGQAEAGDWRYFTEQEIESRGPFVSGGNTVDVTLVAR